MSAVSAGRYLSCPLTGGWLGPDLCSDAWRGSRAHRCGAHRCRAYRCRARRCRTRQSWSLLQAGPVIASWRNGAGPIRRTSHVERTDRLPGTQSVGVPAIAQRRQGQDTQGRRSPVHLTRLPGALPCHDRILPPQGRFCRFCPAPACRFCSQNTLKLGSASATR